jgi:hypothetical protein
MTKSITIRVNEEDARIFKKYASSHDMTVSKALRESLIERIEDEYDYNMLRKEMANKNNQRTYTQAEVEKMLELM